MAYEFFQKLREKCLQGSFEDIDKIDSKTSENPIEYKNVGKIQTFKSNDKKPTEKDSSLDWSEFEGIFAAELNTGIGNSPLLWKFMEELVKLLLTYLESQHNRKSKVLDFHHPHQLKEMMAHCLNVDENPRDLEQILSDCKETLKYCVKTGHPRFLNQFSTGIDMIGVAGELLTAITNTNMFTYEIAPVFVLMEENILRHMLYHVGWEDGDGIFSPGGAISNLYGMLCARHNKFPEIKTKGMTTTNELVVFTSTHSHFSVKRAAAILGIGTDNVVYVECDFRGKMDTDDLEQKIMATINSGKTPLMINATEGTTVLSAFDPVDPIADLCEKYGIWLHIDGAWGGSVSLSETHRHLLHGIQRADSMTWNPHKMMGVPLQCSAFLLKKKQDKHYDVSYDTGDKTIQCGRHNDVFKLWLMWRAKIEGPNVCFWYIPPSIKTITNDAQRNKELGKIAPKLKAAMMEKGSMMVTYQTLGDLPNFFRMAISNPALTEKDLDFVVDEFDRLAEEIF
ncbi:hypothetical protein KUTeg_014924 [Tegillarca granosa]|uniref:Glutamate decarboxylase n=1 Tax=Tegillarca granosa TaxID=220873 RepID=A0ABQ9ETW2_TEGGR|nr:hypothetical protein KUTeg_014924 [Tegillarca granosa]